MVATFAETGLAVLAHHDDGRGVGGLEGEHEVEKDERVRVPLVSPGSKVECNPGAQKGGLDGEKGPAAHGGGEDIGCPFAKGAMGFGCLLHVANEFDVA